MAREFCNLNVESFLGALPRDPHHILEKPMGINPAHELRVVCKKCDQQCVYNERMRAFHCVACGSMISEKLAFELAKGDPDMKTRYFEVVEAKNG